MNILKALLLVPFGMVGLYSGIKELLWVLNISRNGVKTKGQIVDLIENTTADTAQYHLIIGYSIQTGQVLKIKTRHSYINRSKNQKVEILYHKDSPEKMIVNKDKYFHSILVLTVSGIAVIVGLWDLF